MKTYLITPVERMLQGLAYWIAYREVVCRSKIVEAVAVDEAFQILQTHLPAGYKVWREFNYKRINPSFTNKRADLAIVNSLGNCECLIEFKLSDNTGGGYQKDIDKLHLVKMDNSDIDCYVIILYRKSCLIGEPSNLVLPDGRARKKILECNGAKIQVRRVYTALRSLKAKRMKRVICIELI